MSTKRTESFRRLFYLVSPNETSFQTVEEVPKYVDEAIPFFVSLIIIEWLVLFLQGKPLPRFNDGFSSIANGLLSLMHGLLFRSVELSTYLWFYNRYNVIQLPWDDPWTWLLGMIGVDFCYYWVHRSGHEVNIVWAAHQTHHSSEDYNLTTALRQSCILRYFIFPWHCVFHPLFSWFTHSLVCYTSSGSILSCDTSCNSDCFSNCSRNVDDLDSGRTTIRSLGPLEWILNTPSHHRVHHGRNPYCIDKNYGGTLIIFDRIFGTFQAEEEEVVYGLVHPLDSWGPIHAQYMWKTFMETPGLGNKLSVIFKGPGWSPGKPRLGLKEDLPEVKAPVPKFQGPRLPLWMNVYIWIHFGLLIVGYDILAHKGQSMGVPLVLMNIGYIICCLEVFGCFFDGSSKAPVFELIRCMCFVGAANYGNPAIGTTLTFSSIVYWFYIGSVLLWGFSTFLSLQRRVKKVQ